MMMISVIFHFNLPVKIVRPFNTFGPRQSARAIIPTIISQLISGKKELYIGNLSPTRDLTYVKDTVKGFYEIAKSSKLFGEVINIGINKEISIEQLVNLIGELIGAEFKIVNDNARVRPQKSEVERLICNNSKILNMTDWKPEYDFRKGLTETIEWFKNNMKYYKSGIYNV